MKVDKEKFLVRDFITRKEFSICPRFAQSRNEFIKEVDNLVGHLNYSAENYRAKDDLFVTGSFGGIE